MHRSFQNQAVRLWFLSLSQQPSLPLNLAVTQNCLFMQLCSSVLVYTSSASLSQTLGCPRPFRGWPPFSFPARISQPPPPHTHRPSLVSRPSRRASRASLSSRCAPCHHTFLFSCSLLCHDACPPCLPCPVHPTVVPSSLLLPSRSVPP